MLMNNAGRAAKLHYMAGTFRILSPGDHVICAVTGAAIPLQELRYWNPMPMQPQVYARRQARSRHQKVSAHKVLQKQMGSQNRLCS